MQRFEALEVALDFIRSLRHVLSKVRSRDSDLYRQAKRAASSMALNLAEGSGRIGADGRQHFRISRGSALELSACLRVAEAWGYLHEAELAQARKTLDRELGLLWGLTRR